MFIAHRGVSGAKFENKVEHILVACRAIGAVEIDIRYNSNKELVLCHDHCNRDSKHVDKFKDIVDVKEPLTIFLDMKPFGYIEAVDMADEVCAIVRASHHNWKLCSFDQRCVDRMLENAPGCPIGFISSGITDYTLGVDRLDFLSMDHDALDDEDIRTIKDRGLELYLWVTEPDRTYLNVDGLVRNYVYEDLRNIGVNRI